MSLETEITALNQTLSKLMLTLERIAVSLDGASGSLNQSNAISQVASAGLGTPKSVAKAIVEAAHETKGAEAEPTVAEAEPEVTWSDIQAAVKGLVIKIGNAKAAEFLKEFGAKRASEIPTDKYADFVRGAKVILNG